MPRKIRCGAHSCAHVSGERIRGPREWDGPAARPRRRAAQRIRVPARSDEQRQLDAIERDLSVTAALDRFTSRLAAASSWGDRCRVRLSRCRSHRVELEADHRRRSRARQSGTPSPSAPRAAAGSGGRRARHLSLRPGDRLEYQEGRRRARRARSTGASVPATSGELVTGTAPAAASPSRGTWPRPRRAARRRDARPARGARGRRRRR